MNEHKKKKQLGRYELHNEIGQGGMATVYRGYDLSLKRDVAVKVLHPHLVAHTEARHRFEREARSVARLHHDSIVEIYDYAETDDAEVYIVMELVEGFTLREFLNERQQQPIMAECAALIARQIFIALSVAHTEGIVHRDVKPENILISKSGRIRLSDFGIAFLAGIGQMTATGQILGSPTYMSPEHIESPTVDARADIFSVGTILYEMAVGQPPFIGNNPHQIIKRVVEGYYDHPLSVNPSVGHPVASVIVKCLQQQPDRRYQNAQEAIEEIETILTQVGITDWDKKQIEYIRAPGKWEEDHSEKIIQNTLQIGKDAQKNGCLPEAMNHLNRVLAIDPTNETALSAVNVLSKRRQFRRNMERVGKTLIIAIVLLAVVVAIAYYRYIQSENKSSTQSMNIPEIISSTDETLAPQTKPTVASEKDSSLTKTKEPDLATPKKKYIIIQKDSGSQIDNPDKFILPNQSPNGKRKKLRPPMSTAQVVRKVIFNPHPMNIRIIVDDEKPFTYKATDRERMLTVGKHNIQFIPADERLEPLTKNITVESSQRPLTVAARLLWKSGNLLVRSNIQTEVAIDGRAAGRTNLPIVVNIKKGPTRQFHILLSAKGYHPIEKLVSVSAGKTSEIVVHLEKE